MRQAIRIVLAVTLGVATLLFGQLAIENSAWWLTGGTATFDDPLFNAIKFIAAGCAGLGLAFAIGTGSRRGRRRIL